MANFSFDMSDFDEMINDLEAIAEKAHELDGSQVSFDELFDNDFISLHTNADSFDAFLSSANIVIDDEIDLDVLSSVEAFNSYVAENSNFDTWDEMMDVAIGCYSEKKLGL
jgi:hypothetical protein